MSKALEDVVVLDLTHEFFASLTGALLGDFGATVIRVEDLADPRKVDHNRDGMHPPERWNSLDELAHRNKQSLAVNLGDAAGREILGKLIEGADVFLTDVPFEALDERGWDYESLCKLKSDIVYARGSGFGPEGPDRDLPAYDELAAARTGVMPTLVQPGQPPVYTGVGQMQTAVMLALGIVMALYHRDESGEGQIVDASLLGGNMYSPEPRHAGLSRHAGGSLPRADLSPRLEQSDEWPDVSQLRRPLGDARHARHRQVLAGLRRDHGPRRR